jgi:thiamine monophosphate synthase
VAEALLVAPDMLIGASVHSVEEAVEVEQAGASWCVAGTIFETPSHKGRPPARVEFVKMLAAAVTLPVIAIGGVKPENVADLIQAGAYGIATIRGAAWDGHENSAEVDDVMKTRLSMRVDSGFVEPVTRYISAYDSVSGAVDNDHLDGERSTT